jgi:hypothetical protein
MRVVAGTQVLFFSLSNPVPALVVSATVAGVTGAGIVLGRYLRKHAEKPREPLGMLPGALLGVVGLILAFGLSLAVGRYEDRRAGRGRGGERDRDHLPAGAAPRRVGPGPVAGSRRRRGRPGVPSSPTRP